MCFVCICVFLCIEEAESCGFGTMSPPAQIHATVIEWVCALMNHKEKAAIICKDEMHVEYLLEIIKHGFALPVSEAQNINQVINIMEKWILVESSQYIHFSPFFLFFFVFLFFDCANSHLVFAFFIKKRFFLFLFLGY